MRNSLLSLLGLPLVAGFGGLSWVRTAGEPAADGTFTQPATVLRPPGDAGDALNCHDAVWCVCGSGLHSAVVRNQRESHIVMPPSKLAAATRRPSPE